MLKLFGADKQIYLQWLHTFTFKVTYFQHVTLLKPDTANKLKNI